MSNFAIKTFVSLAAIAVLGTTAAHAKNPKVEVYATGSSTDSLFVETTGGGGGSTTDGDRMVESYTYKQGYTIMGGKKLPIIECWGCSRDSLKALVESASDNGGPVVVITDGVKEPIRGAIMIDKNALNGGLGGNNSCNNCPSLP